MNKQRHYISYNLQFFAKDGAAGEKTENATSKKLTDARKEGQVARSTELITAVSLINLFLVLKLFIGWFGSNFIDVFKKGFGAISRINTDEFNVIIAQALMQDVLVDILKIAFPVLISGFIVSFLIVFIQVKWKVSTKLLKPKFSKLNPLTGFKRMFSKDKLVELLMAIAKILMIAYVVYDSLKNQWGMILTLYELPLTQAIFLIGNTVISLGLKISFFLLVIGLIDFVYQKIKFKNDMKMSKQEVKDEYKNSEGDPQIKGRIRQKMREVSKQRMMQSLPQADVVITNPTHLAVAIQYNKETSEAPIVIAKGADFLAQKIREVANENKIEIVENKPLARMLYYNVDLGQEIPQELYQMVAEVLAYVYGLKTK